MADSSRIEDLRRRVQKDPASIAFAQLAEELRRARRFDESIDTCRAGLRIHPGYLSARVTLGRALIEINQLGDAQAELEHVLASAPENLAAIRGLAEINFRNGDLTAALAHYRAALALAKNDPDLQEMVNDLAKKIEPPAPPAEEGLSLEQMARELSLRHPASVPVAAVEDFFADSSRVDPVELQRDAPSDPAIESSSMVPVEPVEANPAESMDADDPHPVQFARSDRNEPVIDHAAMTIDEPSVSADAPADPRSARVVGALENWLEAIHATRDQRGA